MLCPNIQAVTNGYAAGSVGVQDHLFQSVSKFGLGDRKKCIRKELVGAQSHFSPSIFQHPLKFGFVNEEKWKKSV